MSTQIDFDNLSARLSSALKSLNINTADDINPDTYHALKSIKGIGRKTINEFIEEFRITKPKIKSKYILERYDERIAKWKLVIEMRQSGKTFKEIGDCLSVTRSWARHLYISGSRYFKRISNGGHHK